jgi:hypothetical protein
MTEWHDDMIYPEGEDPRKTNPDWTGWVFPKPGEYSITTGTTSTTPLTITGDIDTHVIGKTGMITSDGLYSVTINSAAVEHAKKIAENWTKNAVTF